MRAKDFLSIDQLTRDELARLVGRALEFKHNPFLAPELLLNRTIALVFQKPSLRTRVSFEIAAMHLGGRSIYLSPAEVGLSEREGAADVARVLSGYVDGIVARTYLHRDIEGLAAAAAVPVINGLSERGHPCQVLADLLTMRQRFGQIEGLTVAYVGDGNNVARSLVEATPLAGIRLRVATPPGYEPDASAVAAAREADGDVDVGHDAVTAVRDADVIYTDAWFSMGQEAERDARIVVFPPYRVSEELLACAPAHVLVMHCLPAHRGEEITDEVIEGPHSVVFEQAANRLPAQKAILEALFAGEG